MERTTGGALKLLQDDWAANAHMQPMPHIEWRVGDKCLHDGRWAIVCIGPNPDRTRQAYDVVIRYIDGNRERVLVSAWDCAVEVE